MDLKMKIQNREVAVDWENRTAVSSLMNKLSAKKKISMSRSGSRQVGNLGISVPRNDRAFIAQPGDIGVMNGTYLVFFMEEDDVSCTKLGHFTGVSETSVKNMLSPGALSVELYEA